MTHKFTHKGTTLYISKDEIEIEGPPYHLHGNTPVHEPVYFPITE